jgi:hypothetical protein
MTKQEAIIELRHLAERLSQVHDTMPAASVLHTLCGAMEVGEDEMLMELTVGFRQAMINKYKGHNN